MDRGSKHQVLQRKSQVSKGARVHFKKKRKSNLRGRVMVEITKEES
jgi:hypothetical protein